MTPDQPARTLRILGTRERVAELLRERARDQGVALGLGLIDLRSFEDRLIRASLEGSGVRLVGATEARLAVTAIAPDAARGTTLAGLAGQLGFAEAFLELWDALREAGVDRVGFERLADRVASGAPANANQLSARKFKALARIASAYELRLAALGVVDGVGARVALPGAIASIGRARLRAATEGAERLWIERVAELPPIRARLWEALARVGIAVEVEIPVLPSAHDIREVAPELGHAFELLRRNLVEEAPSVTLVATPLLGAGQPNQLAAAGLIPFVSPAVASGLVDSSLRTKLRLLDAEDQRAELRGVCAAIRELVQRGVPPQQITVAVPRLAFARARVLASLTAAELPHEQPHGQSLISAAPVRLTLALIDAAERELPREALAGLLESAYVARADATALLDGLREAGSRDDRGVGHLGRLRGYAGKLAAGPHPDHERRRRRAQRIRALADRWASVFAALRLPREATIREHLVAVFAAIRALGIPRRCLQLPVFTGAGTAAERRLERDAVAAVARDRAALEALEIAGHGLDEAAIAVGIGDRQISLTELRGHLEAELASARERPAGIRGSGIRVVDLADLARSPSDYTFVIHAVEGELPGASRGLPFLADEDRQRLDRAVGRPVFATSSGVDAGSFALACAGVRAELTISTHRQDADGREVMRSRYFAALTRALGASAAPRVLPAGVVPTLAQSSTRGHLLARLALLDRGSGDDEAPTPSHPILADALAWSAARARDLARASVELGPRARTLAHARLGFASAGPITWRGSATSLEDYATCPFRFFAARILRLRPRAAIHDDLDAAEQGSVRHEVLAEVMHALRRAGLTPLVGGDQTGVETQVAQDACAAVLDRWERLERTGPAPLWLLHRDLVVRDLARVLEGERRAAVEAWEPGEFEAGFGVLAAGGSGSIEGAPLVIPDPRGERRFELVGRVDRIDYRGDGREREGLILDYKSGQVGDRLRYDQVARTQLQLPLYAAWLAAREPGLTYTDAAYVSLRDGERSKASLLDLSLSSLEFDGLLELDPERRQLLRARAAGVEPSEVGPAVAVGALDLPELGQRNLADNVWALLGGIGDGRFDVRPHDPSRTCRYCAFGPVCRIERGDEVEGGEP